MSKRELTVSVIIPTLNRPNHLYNALKSLYEQTRVPDQIVIVDQSDNSLTFNLIESQRRMFQEKGISLAYIWEETRGVTRARNIGVKAASGYYAFFLDDDMIADRLYISEILKIFQNTPDALGVQAIIFPPPYLAIFSAKNMFLNNLRRIFSLSYAKKDTQRVLLSGEIVFANPLTKVINAMYIYPSMSGFVRQILLKNEQDENLKGYSWQEEYFTYKIFQENPSSLYVTPYATIFHDSASYGRPTGKEFYQLASCYELYNFLNNKPTARNWIAFFWKVSGLLINEMPFLQQKDCRKSFIYIIPSYLWALAHLDKVKNAQFKLAHT